MPPAAQKETLGFQAEVKQLLKLVIGSVYSNKEIFLRELVSNASDACDKLRFLAISNSKLYESDPDLKITVSFDKAAKTITVSDNGIGMTRDEVVKNIGTIAQSGTREFLQHLSGDQQKNAQLIGQFGIGFYSSFTVADQVTLKTRKAGEEAANGVLWQSSGDGDFNIEPFEKSARGTEVTLHVRADEESFLDEFRLRDIIKKFSDHISLPVYLKTTDDKGKEKTEQVNTANALWTRPRSQIEETEYKEFYKTASHDLTEPLTWLHTRLEGTLEYTLLLYIPRNAPFDLWTQEHCVGVKLYVKRVFIMDDADKLLPRYLRFMRGIVDSSDLPLNVSRELLQDNQIIVQIKNTAVKKILDLLEDMSKNGREKYEIFWKEFGRVLKEGVVEDFANRERIAKICRFSSSFDDKEKQEVTLDDCIFRLKRGQNKIYYLTAENFQTAKNSPLLEVFRQKGIEVLLMADRVDHWFVSHLARYQDREFQSIAKGDVDLSWLEEAESAQKTAEQTEKTTEQSKEIVQKIKKALGEEVKDVHVSHRLTTSPCCLVSGQDDLDPSLKHLFEQMGQKLPEDKPILEINPHHAILKKISAETDETRLGQWARFLFNQAQLSEGTPLKDPAGFVKLVNELIVRQMHPLP